MPYMMKRWTTAPIKWKDPFPALCIKLKINFHKVGINMRKDFLTKMDLPFAFTRGRSKTGQFMAETGLSPLWKKYNQAIMRRAE
jgi:hypothetical protein